MTRAQILFDVAVLEEHPEDALELHTAMSRLRTAHGVRFLVRSDGAAPLWDGAEPVESVLGRHGWPGLIDLHPSLLLSGEQLDEHWASLRAILDELRDDARASVIVLVTTERSAPITWRPFLWAAASRRTGRPVAVRTVHLTDDDPLDGDEIERRVQDAVAFAETDLRAAARSES